MGHPPTYMCVVALCYLKSHQMVPPSLSAFSTFLPDIHRTGNKGDCSNLVICLACYNVCLKPYLFISTNLIRKKKSVVPVFKI